MVSHKIQDSEGGGMVYNPDSVSVRRGITDYLCF